MPELGRVLINSHQLNRRRGMSVSHKGIVRVIGRELADRRSSRLSRGELTPFRECGSAVLFEDVAAVEVTVVVEVVVD